jgi:choline-sulfatase
MNIAMPDVRHRMVRQGRYKLIWFDGGVPLLFDMEADPDEVVDLSQNPAHVEALIALTSLVLEDWPAGHLKRKQAQIRERTAVLRHWVKATQPSEPFRWVDPDLNRNRFE